MKKIFVMIIMVSVSTSVFSQAVDAPEKTAVLTVVQRFFDAMLARDSAALQSVMYPEGQVYGVRNDPKGTQVFYRSAKDFVKSTTRSNKNVNERMWDATVMLHQELAVVWTPYDLYVDDKFSHCGVDIFTLINTKNGWRITNCTFTVEPDGCKPNPQGVPAGKK